MDILYTHLDTDVVHRYDGVVERGQTRLVQWFSDHDTSGHVDEVNANGLGHEGEGAGCSQVAFNDLNKQNKRAKQTSTLGASLRK